MTRAGQVHAGDLIGHTRAGRSIYLPGGGAEIVVDDKDGDEPDAFDVGGREPDDEPEGEPDPPAKPRRDDRPTYRELQDEIERLRRGNSRNNQELQKRRQVAQWMDSLGITDLDAWLTERGIDKTTGQPASQTAPQPTPEPAPAAGGEDFDRRVALEVERLRAQDEAKADAAEDRATKVSARLKRTALTAALLSSGFVGAMDRALRVADLDSLQVDDEGEVTGVDQAVESLRKDIPEWWRAPRNGRRSGGEDVDGATRPTRPPAKVGWDQRVLSRLTGGDR
jgi:hypothetical protein